MYCTGNAAQLFVAVMQYVLFLFCPNVKQILSIRVLYFLRIHDHTFANDLINYFHFHLKRILICFQKTKISMNFSVWSLRDQKYLSENTLSSLQKTSHLTLCWDIITIYSKVVVST